ncbi:hypothetical protein CVU75_00065 [Candidatus Dependentiae bacterium HGW-Dependentiae-1]|nr:MAG: hypothetical protein CVU75_00065 [Candidatus Dependentiae bacterium HGW-Dependentiae-1]
MIIAIRRVIKEHAAQWLGLVVLAILAFGLFYTPGMRRSAGAHAWVMDINTEKIELPEFRQRTTNIQRQMAMLRAQYGKIADLIFQAQGLSAKQEERAMQTLMQETILNQTTARMGIRFSSEYSMENMPRAQQELFDTIPMELFDPYHGLNVKRLHHWIAQQGLSEKFLENAISNAFSRQLLKDLAAQASYVPAYALEHEALMRTAGHTFSVLSFSREPLLKQELSKPVSQEELLAFYNRENAKNQRYWVPEKRSGFFWSFEPSSYGITVTDQDITSYYDDHKSQRFVQDPAKVQVRHILFAVPSEADRQAMIEKAQSVRSQLIAEPTKFAALAQEFSSDKTSAKEGGLLPFFARGEKEKAFEKVAFTLKANGDISEVIATDKGLEIIQRVEKKASTFKALNQVKTEIEKALLDQKFDETFTAAAREIIDQYAQNPTVLDTFVAEKKGKKTTISKIDRTNEEWGKHLFRLGKGDVTYSLEKNAGVLILLTEITERHLPALADIEQRVTQDLHEERATDALKKQVLEAKKAARNQSLDLVHKQMGGTLETIAQVKPEDKKALEALAKKGLPVEQMFQIEKKGGLIDYKTDTHGSLVRLDELETLNKEQIAAILASKTGEFERESTGLFVRGLIASLARHATIKVNEIEKEELDEQDVASEE